jgi:hypothetical protein
MPINNHGLYWMDLFSHFQIHSLYQHRSDRVTSQETFFQRSTSQQQDVRSVIFNGKWGDYRLKMVVALRGKRGFTNRDIVSLSTLLFVADLVAEPLVIRQGE